MNKLICGLAMALGISLSCHAQGMKISQYPNTNNLAGTNLFLIAIVGSPGTNMNISYAQLSNLLAAALGGGGAQVWTNDGQFIWPLPGPAPTTNGSAPGPGMFFRYDGSLFEGSNITSDAVVIDKTMHYALRSTSLTDSNEPANKQLNITVVNNESDYSSWDYWYVLLQENKDTGKAIMQFNGGITNGTTADFSVMIDPSRNAGGSYIQLSTGFDVVFKVNADGFLSCSNYAIGSQQGITTTIMVPQPNSTTNLLMYVGGILVSNISNYSL